MGRQASRAPAIKGFPQAQALATLRRALLAWYRKHRRDLPWRRSQDPYRIWISEVMLQQTTVQTVRPYYEAFVGRFPTLGGLAAAPLEDVLARWSGLGYYSRARNLQRGAQAIQREHGGTFPRDLERALSIPGVGPYTARAVLSIAYGVRVPVVDGNVRRVLARVLALRGKAWRSDKPYLAPAAALLAPRAPADWNQAVMELGATVCRPREPNCPACPLRRFCRSRAEGLVSQIPEARLRRESQRVEVAAALIEHAGRVLLVQRVAGPLMAGLWELPQTSLASRGRDDLETELRARHGLRVKVGAPLCTVRHAITYRRIQASVYAARLLRPLPRRAGLFRWVRRDELTGLPLSALTFKLLGLR